MTNLEAALQALKDGIIVKRYEAGYNEFYGSELYILFHNGIYQLGVMSRHGFIAVDDYGKTWTLMPKDYYKSETDPDVLFRELYEENFGA